MATKNPPSQQNTGQESSRIGPLPDNSLQPLFVSRLRNPTLYTFPECRHTIVSYAETIATQALLKAKNIPFTMVERYNANHMSPNNQVPLLVQDTLIAGGYDKITNIVRSEHPRLLVASPDTKTYCDLIERSLTPNIEYCQFLTDHTVRDGSSIVASNLPFPLSYIVPLQVRLELLWQFYGKSEDDVYKEMARAMSELNGFIGTSVHPEGGEHQLVVSCKLYGYLRAVMEGFKEGGRMRILLLAYPDLVQFYTRMRDC